MGVCDDDHSHHHNNNNNNNDNNHNNNSNAVKLSLKEWKKRASFLREVVSEGNHIEWPLVSRAHMLCCDRPTRMFIDDCDSCLLFVVQLMKKRHLEILVRKAMVKCACQVHRLTMTEPASASSPSSPSATAAESSRTMTKVHIPRVRMDNITELCKVNILHEFALASRSGQTEQIGDGAGTKVLRDDQVADILTQNYGMFMVGRQVVPARMVTDILLPILSLSRVHQKLMAAYPIIRDGSSSGCTRDSPCVVIASNTKRIMDAAKSCGQSGRSSSNAAVRLTANRLRNGLDSKTHARMCKCEAFGLLKFNETEMDALAQMCADASNARHLCNANVVLVVDSPSQLELFQRIAHTGNPFDTRNSPKEMALLNLAVGFMFYELDDRAGQHRHRRTVMRSLTLVVMDRTDSAGDDRDRADMSCMATGAMGKMGVQTLV